MKGIELLKWIWSKLNRLKARFHMIRTVEISHFNHFNPLWFKKKFILTPIYPRNLIHTVSILKCSLHPTLEKQNYTILSVPSCRDRILKLSRLRIIFLQRLNHSLTFIMMNNVWILEPSCCALWPKLICWKCIPSASGFALVIIFKFCPYYLPATGTSDVTSFVPLASGVN